MKRKNSRMYPHRITMRLTHKEKSKLERLLEKSTFNRNMSELIRDMLFRKKITINTYNSSLDDVKEELLGIKKELRLTGSNINQVTHYFHGHPDPMEKRFYAKKIAHLFESMEIKIESLMDLISDLGSRWPRI